MVYTRFRPGVDPESIFLPISWYILGIPLFLEKVYDWNIPGIYLEYTCFVLYQVYTGYIPGIYRSYDINGHTPGIYLVYH